MAVDEVPPPESSAHDKPGRCSWMEAEAEEFEREPVPEKAQQGWLTYFAIFGGRHTAGTEFSIGPLFVVHGASARDVIVGLFIGNVLATLTWRFLVAPIAVRNRYTTFYQLERICGSKVLVPYCLIVGVLLSVLAGAMFTVSATAVGVMFNVPMPGLYDWLPTSWAWVAVVASVGLVTATVAAFGYSYVSLFSKVMTPYMFAVIIYFGVESLRMLDVQSLGDFWAVANESIWTGHAEAGYSKFGLWHCICSAWFCDSLLHIGMLDLTIMRFAKRAQMGWCSAVGMFPGHYFTWIIAAMLYAVQLSRHPEDKSVAPGPMANEVAGVQGLLCVIVAGWSTANPIMYAAGLAFQAPLGPGWSSRVVTLGVGLLATFAGLFPALVMRILELLAYGGLLFMPMGVVIVADCYLLPRLGLVDEYSERKREKTGVAATNWPAVATWVGTNAVMLPVAASGLLEVFFALLPGMVIASALYLTGTYIRDRAGAPAPAAKAAPEEPLPSDNSELSLPHAAFP